MRVYELAKILGMSSKDLLSLLKEKGTELASHMAIIPDEIEKQYTKNTQQKTAASRTIGVQDSGKKTPRDTESAPVTQSVETAPKNASEKAKQMHQEPIVDTKLHQPDGVLEQQDAPVLLSGINVNAGERVFEEVLPDQEKIDKLLSSKVFRGIPSAPVRRFKKKSRRRRQRGDVSSHEEVFDVDSVQVEHSMALVQVAKLLGRPSHEIIMELLKRGMVCNLNTILSVETIGLLAQHFGIEYTVARHEVGEKTTSVRAAGTTGEKRWPVVVVMGHVDHGKTTLLDYIKRTKVAASEKGGITQHIRAWDVEAAHGKVVFLDTPGHEAFSYLRERGSKITDIAVLVIAADDGIKPQTLEALQHAKAAGVPIIVAINKIDKVSSPTGIETIKRQLSQHDLLAEEWGGSTIIVGVSAKTGQGVDELLDMIVLQSQMMELHADTKVPAKAFVLESRLEKGFGFVATVICKEGTLKQGDFFQCGNATGKVRVLLDCHGKRVTQAGPSTAVQVVGFDSGALMGEMLEVVSSQEYYRAKSRIEGMHEEADVAPGNLALFQSSDVKKSINLIIKTDTRGSKEAVAASIAKFSKLSKELKCPIVVILSGIGDVTEGDIELAANTKSIVLGLHVKIEKNAQVMAKNLHVDAHIYNIIYQMIDYIEAQLEATREPEIITTKVGEAVVKKVFNIKGVGVIAGCYMRDGIMPRQAIVACVRNGKEIGRGKIASLQKDKKSVKEVHSGQECGFMADTFHDWIEGDTVICYTETKEKSAHQSA